MKDTNKKFKFLTVPVQERNLNVHVNVMLIRADRESGPRRGGVRGGQKPGAHSHKGPINSN